MKLLRIYTLILLSGILLFPQCKKEDDSGNPSDSTSLGENTFSNPLLSSGPDPWVFQTDSVYYYTHTLGNRIGIIKTKYVSQLSQGFFKTVWTPPGSAPYSWNLWAPELHYLNNKWYFYFSADDGNDANHRMYVLENVSADPLEGSWEFKGKIADQEDRWAIDGTVFNYNGQMYFLWSGWRGTNSPGEQQIYIAKMKNPWTLDGSRVMISEPVYDWERNGSVNEGPQILVNNTGDVFLVFSASGCWTDNYALGFSRLKKGGDPLNPSDWTKNPTPILTTNTTSSAYAPGHNGFFKSPDKTEDWIIYHANSLPGQGCGANRNPRIQKISWNADGTPNFGTPVKINTEIKRPSGETLNE